MRQFCQLLAQSLQESIPALDAVTTARDHHDNPVVADLRNHVLRQVSASAHQQSGIGTCCQCCDCYLTTDQSKPEHMAFTHCACAPMYLKQSHFPCNTLSLCACRSASTDVHSYLRMNTDVLLMRDAVSCTPSAPSSHAEFNSRSSSPPVASLRRL